MHSLFLKSKAALHSRLKLSGLCPHTSWSKLLCNGNCEQRIVCIIFKSSKKKKNHKHMSYSHCKVLVCYLIRICICYLCERNHIPTEKFEMRKKTEHREKGLKGLECVENIHSNMEDLESSICQMCMSALWKHLAVRWLLNNHWIILLLQAIQWWNE